MCIIEFTIKNYIFKICRIILKLYFNVMNRKNIFTQFFDKVVLIQNLIKIIKKYIYYYINIINVMFSEKI